MKKIKFNLGLLIINIGYSIRKYWAGNKPKGFILRYEIGVKMLQFGYWLRGDIPYKCWNINENWNK